MDGEYAGGAWGSLSACPVCVVLLRLRADCAFSDEELFYQNVKGGQHNFINLIVKRTGDPLV